MLQRYEGLFLLANFLKEKCSFGIPIESNRNGLFPGNVGKSPNLCRETLLHHIVYRGASEKNVYFYTMYVRKKHNRSLEAVLCFNVCIHVACAFDAAAGAANGLKAQRAWVRETGTLTLHGEQTDLSL